MDETVGQLPATLDDVIALLKEQVAADASARIPLAVYEDVKAGRVEVKDVAFTIYLREGEASGPQGHQESN